ncbi:hypothetical protein [uncultured Holdemanella sp.]|uniref:hypothetical protein n=1 Tax=uncultured Holdemanella sp. TaxID=1763549 RepID=UPI0025F3E64C|nr:hypothetical protein [uncultured Holdemanella sp.]
MKTYLTLEKSITHKSNYDGSLYKSYVTSFFSYAKSHHTINDFYDEEGNVYIPEVYSFCEKKIDPNTNELFVRADFEFEDDEDMDTFLHKPLYFKEPAWFQDLANEEIVQLDCIFEQYEPILGPLIERNNISICINGTVQINDKIYNLSKPKIYDFFDEIRTNLGSEKTYKPLLSGACSSRYTLHLKSGKVIKYSGDYALCDGTPYGCKRYTKLIVDDLIKQVYESD